MPTISTTTGTPPLPPPFELKDPATGNTTTMTKCTATATTRKQPAHPPQLAAQLLSGSPPSQQIKALKYFRKLTAGSTPLLQVVIDLGVVPRMVEILKEEDPTHQFEAAWTLTNIAAGTHAQASTVVDANAIPSLVALLNSPCTAVAEQVRSAS